MYYKLLKNDGHLKKCNIFNYFTVKNLAIYIMGGKNVF